MKQQSLRDFRNSNSLISLAIESNFQMSKWKSLTNLSNNQRTEYIQKNSWPCYKASIMNSSSRWPLMRLTSFCSQMDYRFHINQSLTIEQTRDYSVSIIMRTQMSTNNWEPSTKKKEQLSISLKTKNYNSAPNPKFSTRRKKLMKRQVWHWIKESQRTSQANN